jgi:hypothetical protein
MNLGCNVNKRERSLMTIRKRTLFSQECSLDALRRQRVAREVAFQARCCSELNMLAR